MRDVHLFVLCIIFDSPHSSREHFFSATRRLNGHVEVVKFLLERKADPRAKDKSDKTPLDLTKSDEIKEILKNSLEAIEATEESRAVDRAEAGVGGFKKRKQDRKRKAGGEEEEEGEEERLEGGPGIGPSMPPRLPGQTPLADRAAEGGEDLGVAMDNIGPAIPPHILAAMQAAQGGGDEEEEEGVAVEIGPGMPQKPVAIGAHAEAAPPGAKRAKVVLSFDEEDESE